MFNYSDFDYETENYYTKFIVEKSIDYKVKVNGIDVPVYTCNISKAPFNTCWPGHQRPYNQSEKASYINLISDEELFIEVTVLKRNYKKAFIKPYSKKIEVKNENKNISFRLKENGGYILCLDDNHNFLYIFNNREFKCENKDNITYYFKKGVHHQGKITLKSNESVYIEKDAIVYGSIFSENSDNLHIYGNGILDSSSEERFSNYCYDPYPVGNLRLYDCNNIKVQGLGFSNAATWCVGFFGCSNVEVDNINVFGQWKYNTDGVDFVNSSNCVLKNSLVHSFDDSLVVKGLGRFNQRNSENILFENNVLICDWGRALKLGTELECFEVKNISFINSDVIRGDDSCLDIQDNGSAHVHDILFDNIRLELDSFYTPEEYQENDDMKYSLSNEICKTRLLQICNLPYRRRFDYADIKKCPDFDFNLNKDFGHVHDIKVNNINIYADNKYLDTYNPVSISLTNYIDDTRIHDIYVSNIYVNNKKIDSKDFEINLNNVSKNEIHFEK